MVLATLARLFLPSWRFFDDALTGVVLLVRITGPDGEPGGWQQVLHPPSRRWVHVVWNPEGNRILASYSLLERLTQDAVSGGESVAFQRTLALVINLATVEVRALAPMAGSTFEFQLCDRTVDGDEALIASGPHPC